MVRRTEKGVRRTEKRVRRTEKGVRRTEKWVRRNCTLGPPYRKSIPFRVVKSRVSHFQKAGFYSLHARDSTTQCRIVY